jgi:hypothetical protein
MANVNNTNGGVTYGQSTTTAAPQDQYQTITDGLYIQQGSLNRIANALEEILRLVKKDMEESKKRWAEKDE